MVVLGSEVSGFCGWVCTFLDLGCGVLDRQISVGFVVKRLLCYRRREPGRVIWGMSVDPMDGDWTKWVEQLVNLLVGTAPPKIYSLA